MSDAGGQARLFNLETMSGVYPGTRTQVFQRVRLRPVNTSPDASPTATWAQILWYEAPAACIVLPLDVESGRPAAEPLLTVEEPLAGDLGLGLHLQQGLAATGHRLTTCGTCARWRPAAERTADGLPLGACMLRRARADTGDPPPGLTAQSLLALDCPHWLEHDLASPAAHEPVPPLPTAPLPKAAEISDSKKPWLTRVALGIRRTLRPPPPPPSPAEVLVERSGVGAGTEPCFACQGRIANLGALAVEAPEGDKQTFSVWRCRTCHTLYLSDWIDRWERVDSLETEETIYRIAPIEAAEMLTLIGSVQGGDHPGRRSERTVQRTWVREQLERRPVLSHVIKQGR